MLDTRVALGFINRVIPAGDTPARRTTPPRWAARSRARTCILTAKVGTRDAGAAPASIRPRAVSPLGSVRRRPARLVLLLVRHTTTRGANGPPLASRSQPSSDRA